MGPVRYEFTADLSHYRVTYARYRRTHWFYRVAQTIKWTGTIIFVLSGIMALFGGHWLPAVGIAALIVAIWLSPYLDGLSRIWRLKRSPFLNEECSLTCSESGIASRGSLTCSDIKWDAVTNVVRFDDGWLLFYGPHLFSWLSDAKLVDGTLADIEHIFRHHVPVMRQA